MENVTAWEHHRISDLIFEASSEKGYPKRIYAPKDDITPIELAHMMHLFAVAALTTGNRGWIQYDYHEFIERHKLERHFTQE